MVRVYSIVISLMLCAGACHASKPHPIVGKWRMACDPEGNTNLNCITYYTADGTFTIQENNQLFASGKFIISNDVLTEIEPSRNISIQYKMAFTNDSLVLIKDFDNPRLVPMRFVYLRE